jgi:hypothetical protein
VKTQNYPEHTGLPLARLLTEKMLGKGLPYNLVSEAVYSVIQEIANEQTVGDWITGPDGSTWTLTFKPKKQEEVKA